MTERSSSFNNSYLEKSFFDPSSFDNIDIEDLKKLVYQEKIKNLDEEKNNLSLINGLFSEVLEKYQNCFGYEKLTTEITSVKSNIKEFSVVCANLINVCKNSLECIGLARRYLQNEQKTEAIQQVDKTLSNAREITRCYETWTEKFSTIRENFVGILQDCQWDRNYTFNDLKKISFQQIRNKHLLDSPDENLIAQKENSQIYLSKIDYTMQLLWKIQTVFLNSSTFWQTMALHCEYMDANSQLETYIKNDFEEEAQHEISQMYFDWLLLVKVNLMISTGINR